MAETMCRLAQAVLARERPEETFLKSVPAEMDSLEIIYPVCGSTTLFCLHFALKVVSMWHTCQWKPYMHFTPGQLRCKAGAAPHAFAA